MATLQELLDLEGVVVAGEFDFDGSMLDYEANMNMPEEMAEMIAQDLRRSLRNVQHFSFLIR